jgi:Cu2+-exporting ATPase
VAVGAGWLYSVVVTLTGGGDVFYEAASVLAAFVLLGHWFEMRARGGANDAIRTLLDLAPPTAVVLRDGEIHLEPGTNPSADPALALRMAAAAAAWSRTATAKSTSRWSPARASPSTRRRARR